MNKNLRNWCKKADIKSDLLSMKSFRKMSISYLIRLYGNRNDYIRVLQSVENTQDIQIRHYMGCPFNKDDLEMIKYIFFKWGE